MKKDVTRPFILLLFLTVITKVLGFLKTTLIAAFYGMNAETDIYNLADGTVNQLFYSFTIAISIIVLPQYLTKKEQGEKAAKRFAKTAYYSLCIFGVLLFVFAVAVSPLLARILGRTYTDEQIGLLTSYMRILSCGIALSLLTNALQSFLNAERVYGYPSICAIINSAIVIVFILLFSKSMGFWGLVAASPVAFIIQTVLLRCRVNPYIDISLKKEGIDRSVRMLYIAMIPVFISNATMELNNFFDKFLFSGMESGVVTAVSYASVLLVFATNIITIPVTTILFTDVSELCAKKQTDEVRRITERFVVSLLLVCMPIIMIVIMCSNDIVTLVFGYGKFDSEAIGLTASALSVYGFSIVFYILKDGINRVSYALLETKIPMVISIVSVAVHLGASLLLGHFFGMQGVIWGNVISVAVLAIFTYYFVSKKHLGCRIRMYYGSFIKMAVSAAAATAGLFAVMRFCSISAFHQSINAFFNLVIFTLTFTVIYALCLFILKERVTAEFLGQAVGRLRGKGNRTA